ncbi:hypothetical protein SETIT_7G077800v2 [Setaria italica]|uniref:Uncharacterized protein n=1 Tax=Setaria italica TaxID=4555 RepID=A0A368RSY2_SETIT|nr:hypothetical protein SETIT_7G077800v2 [Setaria italica]
MEGLFFSVTLMISLVLYLLCQIVQKYMCWILGPTRPGSNATRSKLLEAIGNLEATKDTNSFD